MAIIRSSTIGDFTRGGQTTLHFLRMIGQVLSKFGSFILFCLLVFFVTYFLINTTNYDRYLLYKWSITSVGVKVFKTGDNVVPFELPTGERKLVRAKNIVADSYINKSINGTILVAVAGGIYALLIIGAIFVGIVIFIYKTGNSLRQEEFLRGGKIVDGEELGRILKKRKQASDLKIGNVPLMKNAETSHILITGSPGAGKSVAIKDLLECIRKRGDRAIVFSTAGEFIENFYRPKQDVILNPLDARCPAWHIWCDGRNPSDYDNIAASLIPEATGATDPFWVLAARTIFSTIAMRMHREGRHSTTRLLQDLLTIELDEAATLVKGTEGGAIIAEGAEKTALSVRATLAAHIRSLKFLKSVGETFSIRQWVNKDEGDDWVFISSRPDQKETLKPLITLWLDIATSSILSLPENLDRRIWLIIDELPSLNKVPSLEEMLAQSRKFGGCVVLGFQSYAQLVKIYSPPGAEAMTGLCSTWLCYRANEAKTAEWASKAFGNSEQMEPSEGLSYGANEIRDGMTLNMNRQLRPLVLPTEMMKLPNLRGYVRLPGDVPVGRLQIIYRDRQKVAPAFIEGDLSDTSWDFSMPDFTVGNGLSTSKTRSKATKVAASSTEDDSIYHDLPKNLVKH